MVKTMVAQLDRALVSFIVYSLPLNFAGGAGYSSLYLGYKKNTLTDYSPASKYVGSAEYRFLDKN